MLYSKDVKITTETDDEKVTSVKKIQKSILLKCADGQKRMAELSLQTIADLCSNQTFMVGNCGQIQR